ncbi:MAG: SIS domain-containing protein [Spirochaetota bacterium]
MENALNELVHLDQAEKERRGILYTPAEIQGQVELWADTCRRFEETLPGIRRVVRWLEKKRRGLIMLTGAGSSGYVGLCVEGLLRVRLEREITVHESPRLVSAPAEAFAPGHAVLLVSFARSGDSPESVGAVELALQHAGNLGHLVVTCNPEGVMARRARALGNAALLVLNPLANDRGLAMTASFTNMVIAAQMLGYLGNFDDSGELVHDLVRAGRSFLAGSANLIKDLCTREEFDRAVFLGSGANLGTAAESHLKLQELSGGRVMCGFNTYTGIRHGPMAAVDPRTLVVCFLSEDGYTRSYELDLLRELRAGKPAARVLLCCSKRREDLQGLYDYLAEYAPDGSPALPDELTPPVYVMAGQLLGLFTALRLGLSPDNPGEETGINRVVRGVRVYDHRRFLEDGSLHIIAER